MSIIKRPVLLFVCLVLIFLFAPAVMAGESAPKVEKKPLDQPKPGTSAMVAPQAFVPVKEHDFGVVLAGQSVTYDFEVHNQGQGVLLINQVTPG